MKHKLLILPFIALIFLSALPLTLSQTTTAAIDMKGIGWTLKVDSQIQTAEILSDIQVTSKSATEKELSIIINDIKEIPEFTARFKVDTTGLTLYKQLPLTAELNATDYDILNATHAIREGETVVYRPENVLNSYACFDGSGRKVAHIYGSKLIDAKGNYIWVDQELKNGILTVMLDSKWMETATYPVTLDPTFGYTEIGGTIDGGNNNTFSSNYTSPTGQITSITAYTDGTVKYAIYNSTGNRVAITNESSVGALGWHTLNLVSPLDTTGENIWLSFGSAGVFAAYYDSNTEVTWCDTGYVPDSITGDAWKVTNRQYSIYANYTEPEPTPTPSPTPTATPTEAQTLSYTWLYTGLLIFMAIANILLIGYRKSPIINFIFGIVSICIVAVAAGYASYIVFYPLPNVLLGLVAIVALFSAGLSLRGS